MIFGYDKLFRLIANRDDLVKRALAGQGRVANDLYSFSDPVYDHSIAQRKQDLNKAKALLKEAGFNNSLTVDLYTGPDSNAALVLLNMLLRQVSLLMLNRLRLLPLRMQ